MSQLFSCHVPARNRFGPCSYCGFAIPRSHRRQCPCRAVYYCNELCQKRDWVLHKNICLYDGWESATRRALKSLPNILEDYIFDVFLVGRKVKRTYPTEFRVFAGAALRVFLPATVGWDTANLVAEGCSPKTLAARASFTLSGPFAEDDVGKVLVNTS